MLEYLDSQNLATISPLIIYSVLFVVSFLEGMPIIGSIFAGGAIVIGIGTLAAVGIINPILGIIIAALGSWFGDLVGFFILRHYGHRIPFLKKLIVNIREHKGRFSDTFDRHYFLITVISRVIPFVRSTSSLIGSVRAIPEWKHIPASLIASIVWSITVIFTGYGLLKIISIKYIIAIVVIFFIISTAVGIIRYKK